jgi:co-chaperonin GroES (HSP10)
MSVSLLEDRVLVRPIENNGSAIIIPDAFKNTPSLGTIEKLGPFATTLKIGQKVIFNSFKAVKTEVKKETFLMMREKDIEATINE